MHSRPRNLPMVPKTSGGAKGKSAKGKYSQDMRQEAFQRGCLSAVAAAAGIGFDGGNGPDFHKADNYLTLLDGFTSVSVIVQLKTCTTLKEENGEIIYDLEAETFNMLRNPQNNVPRCLILMDLPATPGDWTECSHDRLLLKRRMFWAHFYGEDATPNTYERRVRVPRSQMIDSTNLVAALKDVNHAFKQAQGA